MNTTVVWTEYSNDFVIVDYGHENQQAVSDYLDQYKFDSNIIFIYLQINKDPEAIAIIKNCIKHFLKLELALVAQNKKTKEVVAIALLKTHNEDPWIFLGIDQNNIKVKNYFKVKTVLIDIELKRKKRRKQPSNILQVFNLLVSPEHKGHSCKLHLLQSAFKLAHSMFLPSVLFVAMNRNDQNRCRRLRMTETVRMYYGHYKDSDGKFPITNITGGEYYAQVFEKLIPPAIPYQDIIIN